MQETFFAGKKARYPKSLVNTNTQGGYDFKIDEGFTKDAHKRIIDAIDEWRCKAKVNFDISCTTIPNSYCHGTAELFNNPDEILNGNIDFTISLSSGTLPCNLTGNSIAKVFTEYYICPGVTGNEKAYLANGDIVFRDDKTDNGGSLFWDYANAVSPLGQSNFKNVLMHELGHLIGLEHNLDNSTIMHVTNDFKITLDPIDTDQAEDIVLNSSSCGDIGSMIPIAATSCNTTFLNNCPSWGCLDFENNYSISIGEVVCHNYKPLGSVTISSMNDELLYYTLSGHTWASGNTTSSHTISLRPGSSTLTL